MANDDLSITRSEHASLSTPRKEHKLASTISYIALIAVSPSLTSPTAPGGYPVASAVPVVSHCGKTLSMCLFLGD